MNTNIPLWRELFTQLPHLLLKNDAFQVTASRYPSGVEALEIKNSRGNLIVLPWMGQMIWGAEFDGHNLTMKNMFTQPKPVNEVIGTYGCFAYHSGLLANGCPAPDDTHPLHGEMPCAPMDEAWIELTEDTLTLCGRIEYVMGFGHHYRAEPRVTLHKDSALFEISMSVTNLASVNMPLQYMCHMNYAYVAGATFGQNIPAEAWRLRESIPAHVTPIPTWTVFNQDIQNGRVTLDCLNQPECYDPEIVFFADELDCYTAEPEFTMTAPDGTTFLTRFSSTEFNYATRWILHNDDQKVAAFVLPATCRPEGFKAANLNGTLIQLAPNETKVFKVTTGIA